MKKKETKITNLKAREILDSRGNPTLEVELTIDASIGIASVPSGASTGRHEAHELRDGDPQRYDGLGVLKAVNFVNTEIRPAVVDQVFDQVQLDTHLIALDGTEDKHRLGANSLLGVSMAFARAAALVDQQELYQYLGRLAGVTAFRLPTPLVNILNGGKHADSGLDLQEFMLIPAGIRLFRNKIRICAEIFHTLKEILHQKGYTTGVGDEGGFAPQLTDNEQALQFMTEAIARAGYTEQQVKIGLDAAATSFFKNGRYQLQANPALKKATSRQVIDWYKILTAKYPLMLIEDGLAEDDWLGFRELNQELGKKLVIVGDDLTVTNTKRIEEASRCQAINAVLIKLNQIGTVSEALKAIQWTEELGWTPIISHRSGETTDTFIADLAVGTSVPYLKAGSMSRGERIAKYDRLLAIEEQVAKNH